MAIAEEDGIRVLWKYRRKDAPIIYYSWERWASVFRNGYYEYRFPPPKDWIKKITTNPTEEQEDI